MIKNVLVIGLIIGIILPGIAMAGWVSMDIENVLGDPAVAQNADGRLEVFVRTTDGLFHRSQTVPNGGWSPNWESLGGRTIIGDPAVARNADGRLEVVVRKIGGIYHKNQTAPNGGWSPNWKSLGRLGLEGGSIIGDPVIAQNADGRLDVFVLKTDGVVYHKKQTRANGDWSNTSRWGSLGGTNATNIAVGRNEDGRLDVFVRRSNGVIYHKKQHVPNGDWRGNWESIGFDNVVEPSDTIFIGDPVVAQNEDGRLEVFTRTRNNNGIFHIWQNERNGDWRPIWSIINSPYANPILTNIAVGRNKDGRLELFARSASHSPPGNYHHTYQIVPNGDFRNWGWFGGSSFRRAPIRIGDPAVAQNEDGRLEVFTRTNRGELIHRWQTVPNGDMSQWN